MLVLKFNHILKRGPSKDNKIEILKLGTLQFLTLENEGVQS